MGLLIPGADGVDVSFLGCTRRAAELAQSGLLLRSPLGDLQVAVKTVLSQIFSVDEKGLGR